MSAAFWRRASLVLGVLCIVQTGRACSHDAEPAAATDAAGTAAGANRAGEAGTSFDGTVRNAASRERSAVPPTGCPDAASSGPSFYGFRAPGWAMALLPQRGEDLLSYRDRIVPIARTAIAPQRERVTRMRDELTKTAHLDPAQRATLDSATSDAADAIETRVMSAAMNGDFAPANFRPMNGVKLARDVLDDISHSDDRFRASLTDDQRTALAQQPFDFADYLVFSTPWEQALGYTE